MDNIILDNQTLILGDCLKVLPQFEDNYFDQIITSPPYNIGIKYNEYQDTLEKNIYLEWLHKVFSECKRTLKNDGSFFLNIGGTNTNPWIPFDVAQCARDLFIMQNHIIWVKSISIRENSYGHYKPINSERYTNHTFEHVFHFTKNGKVKINKKAIGVPYVYKCNLKAKTITEDLRCRGDCWFIPYETIQTKEDRGNHPATFPKDLVEWCIKLAGFNKESKILDPFSGSGTLLLVTRSLNCKGFGIEIDKDYFNYSFKELSKGGF